MQNPPTIPTNSFRHESEDYTFLREEGLKYIESLASKLWTDYNVHDPGITTMEALCVAITDLAYRTSFDIKDILAKEGVDYSVSQPPIFTARDILTCNPWTLTDLRKLLVDVDGIFNAWLFIADKGEVDFYGDCKKSELSYFESDYKIEWKKLGVRANSAGSPVLQEWIVSSETTEDATIEMPLVLQYIDTGQANTERRVSFLLSFPGWEPINDQLYRFLPFINATTINSITLLNTDFNNEGNIWQSDVLVDYERDGVAGQIRFPEIVIPGIANVDMQTALESLLTTVDDENIFVRYQRYLWKILSRLVEQTVMLRGLYDVILEYETDDQFGDLNSDLFDYTVYIPTEDGETPFLELDLDILMPSWKDIYANIKDYYDFIESKLITSVTTENSFVNFEEGFWRTDLRLEYAGQDGAPDIVLEDVEIRGVYNQDQLNAVIANIELLTEGSILGFFHGKLKRLLEITEAALYSLQEHRNLCEDYLSIAGVCINEVAICADIELSPDASLEKVQAEIYYLLEQYLSPPIRFYSLKEMVDSGVPSEDIFNGPALNHGFIKSEEIEATDLDEVRYVYASDIINLIMDVEGVLAVKDLLMTKYDVDGNPVLPSQRWCVKIDYRHKARLSIDKSKFLFFKDGLPYILDGDREKSMLKKLDQLRAINDRSRLWDTDKDYETPIGTPLEFSHHTPLRMSFADNYGIGEAGLSETASAARKAKAKQLQAYLAIFDQILVNYLSQLENTCELFSLDKHAIGKLKKTYYTHFLTEEEIGGDLYVDPDVLEDLAGTEIGPRSLQRLSESHEEYLDRRNRFLDHLLARFAEQFTDYTLLLNTTLGEKAPAELIQDKISFLEEYHIVSSQRGKGFNYKDEARIWDTDNVTGLQKRVSRLLGMENYNRRDLHCETIRDFFQVIEVLPAIYSIELERDGTEILNSPKTYPNEEEAFVAKERTIGLAYLANNYDVIDDGGDWRFQIGRIIRNPDGDILSKNVMMESVATYPSEEEATDAAEAFRQQIRADFEEPCEEEGFHVVEHILLRPKSEFEDHFFSVCLPENCGCCGEEDPYSFRVTIILPYWMERFDDRLMRFREYINRLFRQEAPAHIFVKVCWVSNEQMRQFETLYRRWLEENAKRCPDQEVLTIRLNALIYILDNLKNVYYEGYLHDCEDSEQENTIILGKSFLGSFDPSLNEDDEEDGE